MTLQAFVPPGPTSPTWSLLGENDARVLACRDGRVLRLLEGTKGSAASS